MKIILVIVKKKNYTLLRGASRKIMKEEYLLFPFLTY